MIFVERGYRERERRGLDRARRAKAGVSEEVRAIRAEHLRQKMNERYAATQASVEPLRTEPVETETEQTAVVEAAVEIEAPIAEQALPETPAEEPQAPVVEATPKAPGRAKKAKS